MLAPAPDEDGASPPSAGSSPDEDDAREGYTHADWQYSAEEWALVRHMKQSGNETDEHFEQYRRRRLRELKEREERLLAE